MYRRLVHELTNVYRKRLFSTVIKAYPKYVERQAEIGVATSSNNESIEIDGETKMKTTKPDSYIQIKVNYVDTDPIGDKRQPIVLLVHGYPGNHEMTRGLIEEFQRRNFRCIAPDMPFCGKTKLAPLKSFFWNNSIDMRGRLLGELLKHVMQTRLSPIHTIVGCNENAYATMSLLDQYEYFHCRSLILINPVPRRLIRFPLSKLIYDFGPLPLLWPIAKLIFKLLDHNELLTYSQTDMRGAIRLWLLESSEHYDAYLHNLWLSRMQTMVIQSQEDKYLDQKLFETVVNDLAVTPFNKSNMSTAVIKKYSCNQVELFSSDRTSNIVEDIETFLSSMKPFHESSIRTNVKPTKAKVEKQADEVEFDPQRFKIAKLNDFFTEALGPSEKELKPGEHHSIRSAIEKFGSALVHEAPEKTIKQELSEAKNELRKKRIRIVNKS